MVEQLARPKDKVEVYWFSEQPNGYITDEDVDKYDSARLGFPNSHFDPEKAHVLYNEYHEQYALADEVGFDGIMTNEHHAAYWCMKPAVNLDAAVVSKVTKNVKIAMLDCYSGGRIISGFVRGGAVESLQGGIDPTENRAGLRRPTTLSSSAGPSRGPSAMRGSITITGW